MTVGIDPHEIRETWKAALDDTQWHIENRTYGPIETILRLHHRTFRFIRSSTATGVMRA